MVGVLPTERTVAMKRPEVTRAISAAIFGRLATGRWLRTLIEAKRKVHRGVAFRQFAHKVCNVECEFNP